jgi:hypothetical protein
MGARWSRRLLIVGGVLVAGAVVFRVFAVPALVRFPDDLDETLHYRGTYTSYFDEETLAPRAEPLVLRFGLDRHLEAVDSSFSTVTILETLTFHIGDRRPLEQQNQYVMNRRTMELQDGDDSWAFDPSNEVDRSGSYRIQLPLGTSHDEEYPIWNNETSQTSMLVPEDPLHYHPAAATQVVDFTGSLDHAVTPAYRQWLAANDFPMTIAPDQIQAQLAARGVNVAAALAEVGPRLSAQESAVLADALGNPIPIDYFFVYEGHVSIEPRTGSIMDVHTRTEGLAVKPDLSGVAKLQPLLEKYSSIPSIAAVSQGLRELAGAPADLAAEFRFTETQSSSRDTGSDAKEQARLMRLLQLYVPWSVGALSITLIAVGIVTTRRGRTALDVVVEERQHQSPEQQP